ncbi:MAG TPA: hypothetical protein VK525_15065 [Candidatus Saccharimonadales bacterium]|nr:hypothetical protein [Candidatus Saccharimonadales bacterium]
MRLVYLVVTSLMLLPVSPRIATIGPYSLSFASDYSRDAKGLEGEYQPFLDALNKGQTPPFDKEFSSLTIPDPALWFGEYFETEQVQALVDDYKAEVAKEKLISTFMTKFWPSGTHFKVHCKPHRPSSAKFPPRPDAYEPKKEISIERFEVEFKSDKPSLSHEHSYSMSFSVNVVWVDGAYRYLGGGAYPFWAMPETLEQRRSK